MDMKTRRIWLVAVAVSASMPLFAQVGSLPSGFTPLFDGKTTAGWRTLGKDAPPGPAWVVEDGTFKLDKKSGKPGGNIVTQESFENFELEAPFAPGQRFTFGVPPAGPESLGFGAGG